MGILIAVIGVVAIIGMILGIVKRDKKIKQITVRLFLLDFILYVINYVLYK